MRIAKNQFQIVLTLSQIVVCKKKRNMPDSLYRQRHQRDLTYFGKVFAIGVMVAELDFESISSIVSDKSPRMEYFSSIGE